MTAVSLLLASTPARAGVVGVELAPYDAVKFGPDLAAWSAATGQKQAVLAFYNGDPAAPGQCRGAWPVDESKLLARVKAFRARGGTVIVSSGGWNADDLARHCTSPQALAEAYDSVLERFGTDHLDLDLEAGDQFDNLEPVLVDRRSAALRLLQNARRARGRRLDLTFTLAAAPTYGLDERNLYVLRSARAAYVRIGSVNAMLMDYCDGVSVDRLSERGILALERVRDELAKIIPGLSDARYWRMISATAMVGQNDSRPEVFTLGDASALSQFARQRGLKRIGFWSLARDNASCAGARNATPTCSGVRQDPWAFTRAFAAALTGGRAAVTTSRGPRRSLSGSVRDQG